MLDKHQIETIARAAHTASLDTTNASRNTLRKLTRQVLNDTHTVPHKLKNKFTTDYGQPVNKIVDQVHRNVLLDLILGGLKTAETDMESYIWDAMERVGSAMGNDSLCQPSGRGGVSRGLHINTVGEDVIQRELLTMFEPSFWDEQDPDAAWYGRASRVVHTASYILSEQFGDKVDAHDIAKKMCVGLPIHVDTANNLLGQVHNKEGVTDYDELSDDDQFFVDALCTDYITAHGKVEFTPKQDEEAKPTKDDGVVVDPNLKQGVDALLGQATGGKVKDINVLIKSHKQVADLEAELDKLPLRWFRLTNRLAGTRWPRVT